MQRYAILQSGFISVPHGDLVLPIKDPINETINNVLQGKTNVEPPQKYHYDKTITDLYHQYTENHRVITKFEYRERLLQAALHAFSHNSLNNWIDMQSKSEFFTFMHKEFILDTLHYLTSGSRKINIESWPFLLEVRQATLKDRDFVLNYSPYIPEYTTANGIQVVGIVGSGEPPKPYWVGHYDGTPYGIDKVQPLRGGDIRSVLIRWASIDNGYSDLIQALNIIFGSRDK